MIGNSSLASKIRVLVSLELFLYAEFYADHPSLHYIYNFNKALYSNLNHVLHLCLSHNVTDSGLSSSELIKKIAIDMCQDRHWAPFICVFSLSSVLRSRIHVFYPDFGPIKYCNLFNNLILPRLFYESCSFDSCNKSIFNILYCRLSFNKTQNNFQANHFVPLISYYEFKAKQSIVTNKRIFSLPSTASISAKKPKVESSSKNCVPLSKNIFDYFKSKVSLPSATLSFSPPSPVVSSPSIITSSSVVTSSSCIITSTSNSVITTQSSASLLPIQTSSSVYSSPLSSPISLSTQSVKSPSVALKPSKPNLTFSLGYSSVPCERKHDISLYYQMSKTLSAKEKYDLIINCFKPEKSFKFPHSNGTRPFLYKWLEQFDWLRYSKTVDGGFCLPCSLFLAHSSPKFQNQGNLILKPVHGCKNSTTFFKRHQDSPNGLHNQCLNDMKSFLLQYEGMVIPVNVQLNEQKMSEIVKTKKFLPSIIDTIILCGHLGIPLRGHRDDSKYYPKAGEYSKCSGLGNFMELINFAIRRGDQELSFHYSNHALNLSYFSKTTQNEVIDICGDLILEQVISSIKHQPNYYYSIIADEAMDSASKEQLSLVFRYVNSAFEIKEDFVGFVHLINGLSGKAISLAILKKISDLGLDISRCRGQGYDGAGSVAGVKNGAAAHILRINKKALYTHCFSHRLNLVVSKNFKIISVSNMLETAQKLSYFFQFSEQRQKCFEKHVKNFCPCDVESTKLRDPCKTRWVERIKDLHILIELFEPLWYTLDDMKMNHQGIYNRNTQNDSFSFFKAIDNFDFIANLVITYSVLEFSLLITQTLQSKKNDLSDAKGMVKSLLNNVAVARRDVEEFHDKRFAQALLIARRLNIPVSKPRANRRQIFRENHPTETISDFYRVSLTIPLLDTLEQELTSRFNDDTFTCFTGIYLLPSKIKSMEEKKDKKPLRVLCKNLVTFYKNDLPFPERIDKKLDLWETEWLTERNIFPASFVETLKCVDFTGYHNIKELLKILATLPITSCECERSFSGMKRIKTNLRSTMGQERMNGLSLLNFHLDKVPESATVSDRFLAVKNRKR